VFNPRGRKLNNLISIVKRKPNPPLPSPAYSSELKVFNVHPKGVHSNFSAKALTAHLIPHSFLSPTPIQSGQTPLSGASPAHSGELKFLEKTL